MERSNVLLFEDLRPDGERFAAQMNQLLPEGNKPLKVEQSRAVIAALCPDLRVPIRVGVEKTQAEIVTTQELEIGWSTISQEQEQIAKSIGSGHRLLRGIAGTGKYFILLYRAKLLAVNNPDQRILVLCWNTSLANYMRQTYDELGIEGSEGKIGEVRIFHFSEFSKDLISRTGHSVPLGRLAAVRK